ncbi:MAG: hypothetical protein R2832_19715 [Rhodothermales bacterium]
MTKIRILVLASTLIAFVSHAAYAQRVAVSLQTNYPVAIGDTFLSNYGGSPGVGATIDVPIRGFLIRPTYQYYRIDNGVSPEQRTFEMVAALSGYFHFVRIGFGRSFELSPRISLVADVGVGGTHFLHKVTGSTHPNSRRATNGASMWVGINPTYRIGGSIGIGFTAGYNGVFLEKWNNTDTGYDHQYHAVSLEGRVVYYL